MPGSGILRPFPSEALPHLDPFVFLDTGAPRALGDGEIYVGPHAHRGVQPVSVLFRGRIEHRDSLGNHVSVSSGGSQWLVAGAGALHEEVLRGDDEGVFHMAQLWVNVPAAQKMDPPAHHAVSADRVPEIDAFGPDVHVRLFAGELEGHQGPAPAGSPVVVAHVTLAPGGAIELPVSKAWNAMLTVVDGVVRVGDEDLEAGATPVFENDGEVVAFGSLSGGQVLLMMGAPIGEPIATGGGFVMNTQDEIELAFADLRAGEMGSLTASR